MAGTTLIATRESRLALWQAEHVRELLTQRFGMRVELLGMTTRGDQILDRTLSKVGGKGLFVKELETALEEGRAQLAVHSLKDVPMDLPAGFELAAVLADEALAAQLGLALQALPQLVVPVRIEDAVGRGRWQVAQVEQLLREIGDQRLGTRIRQHPAHLLLQHAWLA